MPQQRQHPVIAVILTGLILTTAAGCLAVPVPVPIPGPGHVYGPPAPVLVVPRPYGGYYGGGHRRHHHRHGYYR